LRRSIATSKSIKKNEKISLKKIKFLRPGIGINIKDLNKVLGKKSKAKIEKNTIIKKEFLK
tara:strand:+ start:234 stop:416 length:183 start_codon:yes stop_codon:yes gene_type:complete